MLYCCWEDKKSDDSKKAAEESSSSTLPVDAKNLKIKSKKNCCLTWNTENVAVRWKKTEATKKTKLRKRLNVSLWRSCESHTSTATEWMQVSCAGPKRCLWLKEKGESSSSGVTIGFQDVFEGLRNVCVFCSNCSSCSFVDSACRERKSERESKFFCTFCFPSPHY